MNAGYTTVTELNDLDGQLNVSHVIESIGGRVSC
jgi:hypothetical protein